MLKRRLLMGGLGALLALTTSACHVPGHLPEIDLSDVVADLGLSDDFGQLTTLIGDLLP